MLYNFKLFKKYPSLFVAFSEKKDGSMKFPENNPTLLESNLRNRGKILNIFGIFPENVSSGELCHGNQVEYVSLKNKGARFEGTDGLITDKKNIFLSITAADCLPIFLFEPKKEIIGMIHAGWRSLEKGILSNAVGKIKKLSGTPENILAGIGPAICQKHYEVGRDVAENFAKYPKATKRENGKIYLDIKEIAHLQLLDLGIKKENIEVSTECTFELSEKYFSARREKSAEIEAMVAVIGMKE
jgi:polyphenol oxidase